MRGRLLLLVGGRLFVELPEYVGEPALDGLRRVITIVSEHLPETREEIFVSMGLIGGGPDYLSAWLFTANLIVEVRNPLAHARIQYEMAPLKGCVDWIRLNARRYEFKEPAEDSELDLEFTTTDGLSGVLSSYGQGCRHLMDFFRRRFLANFTGTYGAESV